MNLLNLFNPLQTAGMEEEFDAIKIGIASPETIRSWSYGEVKNLKPSTTVRSNPSATACSAPKSFTGQRLRMLVRKIQTIEI